MSALGPIEILFLLAPLAVVPLAMRLTAALPLSRARRIWVTDEEDQVVLDARVPVST